MINNKDFLTLTESDFDKTILGISALSAIVAPFLLKMNHDGKGLKDVAEFTLDLQIAADALREIKTQVYGLEDKSC